jgi:hypothetical protein
MYSYKLILEQKMKTLFRRSLTTFMCVGTLIAGTQSWAADAKQTSTVSTAVKADIKEQGNVKNLVI